MSSLMYFCLLVTFSRSLKYVAAQDQEPVPRYVEVNTPISLYLPAARQVALRVDGLVDNAISFVLLQVHTHRTSLTLSLTASWRHGYSTQGKDVGAIAMVAVSQTSVDFFVNATSETQAIVMATAYMSKSPVPGGCSLEFPLRLDPNLHVTWDNNDVTLTFQYANFGSAKDSVPAPCEQTDLQKRLTYDVYQFFLPGRDWREATYLASVRTLLRADQLRQRAVKVRTVEYQRGQTRVRFAAYPGQGVMFGLVVREVNFNNNTLTAAYVPVSTYTCDFSPAGQCQNLNDFPMEILSCILGVFGLILCFAGHRFFKFSMFTFGMLACGLLGYILIMRFSPLTTEYVLLCAALCSLVGGVLWLIFWCFLGVPVLSVLLPGLVMGFCASAVVFNLTSFGLIEAFESDFNYGMAFSCGVLILPVILLAFTKKLSLLSCTMVGAYLLLAAADAFLHSGVAYVVLNAIRKAALPGYVQTVCMLPLQLPGVMLLIGWGVLALVGLIVQSFTERDEPDFPACPYDRFRERQQRQRQMEELAGSRGTDGERQRLLGDRPTRNRNYGRSSNIQRFQETPPQNPSPPPSYSRLSAPLL